MDSIVQAEKLLSKVCEVDNRIKNSMDEETKAVVIKELASRFSNIIEKHPDLLDEIQERISKHQAQEQAGVTDFIHLVEWYDMCLSDTNKDVDYWNRDGKYFALRMNEVINLYLLYKLMEIN